MKAKRYQLAMSYNEDGSLNSAKMMLSPYEEGEEGRECDYVRADIIEDEISLMQGKHLDTLGELGSMYATARIDQDNAERALKALLSDFKAAFPSVKLKSVDDAVKLLNAQKEKEDGET